MTPADFRAARKAWGLRQSDLAPLLGLGNASRVGDIETGKAVLSNSVRRLMQAYLDGYRPADWPSLPNKVPEDRASD
jgi:predicted transcriptional regulator